MAGGNAWVPFVLASAVSGSPNYDPTNDQLLNQGPGVLTVDLNSGLGIDPAALLAGVDRAKQELELAAAIENLSYNASSGTLNFRIQNRTGHKLISGFPEGRRMFVNIRAYSGGSLIYEVNPYDIAAGTLKGLTYPYQAGYGLPAPSAIDSATEAYVHELVYEMHPASELTGEDETFHFALATDRYKDNRIPPKGFRISEAGERLSQPRWHGADAPDYFTAAEYAGGYDDVDLADYGINIHGADYVEVNLYYQTTSREYIEFLRDEIKGTGNLTLTGTGAGGDPAYLIQDTAQTFFDKLRAWGDTIWQLWTHNMNVDGAAPYLMAQATLGVLPSPIAVVSTESALYTTGSTQTLFVGLTNPGAETTVDAYLAVMLPEGSLYFLEYDISDGDYYFHPGTLEPATWTPAVIGLILPQGYILTDLELLQYTFTGSEPTGDYTWYIGLSEPGTTDFVSDIGSSGFSFTP
jgi:hypothetical protein